ncbi:TIGR04255 family protein [Pseudomonas sp. TUM22785]|uniref:TIGR04255 family protein n=1 Tax=Pseudomonas sp. TUM22785 TaxID=3019098 RepID=UPI0023064D31|nr:TIGR04255 family protein [Pseudomonas sp. TUM22785]WCD79176.1 TIGR04255 family protein [Pseudomonas sp. TUM22785]
MPTKLPTRLGKKPLVDAVFEIRFQCEFPLASLLSGIIYTELHCSSIDRLPQSEIPEFIRKSDPVFHFTPLNSLRWGSMVIYLSDNSVILNAGRPYPGWAGFLESISGLLSVILNKAGGIVGSVSRFSIKYTDVIEIPKDKSPEDFLSLELSAKASPYSFRLADTHIRSEILIEDSINIVDVFGAGTINTNSGITKTGTIVSIDSIVNTPQIPISEFIHGARDSLTRLHDVNKELFFGFLSEEGLAYLEPHYEP